MRLFRVLFVFDAGVAVVIGLVLCAGLADSIAAHHVDREDLLLWPLVATGVAAALGGGWWLQAQGRLCRANVVLLAMAVPSLAAGLFLLAGLANLAWPGSC